MEPLLDSCESRAKEFVDNLSKLRLFIEEKRLSLDPVETKDFLCELSRHIPSFSLENLHLLLARELEIPSQRCVIELDSSEDDEEVDTTTILCYPMVIAVLAIDRPIL